MKKKIKIIDIDPNARQITKIAEFRFAYEENAQRIAYAYSRSAHFVKVRFENASYFAYIVEIYH